MIRVSKLRKTFGSTVAVDGVSFEVREGQIVGFLGPNGAGKSTTMRMLTTFLDPDEGTIEIAGIDALAEPLAARRRLGYLPESAPLYEEMGVVETLEHNGRVRGLAGARLKDRVDAMVDACGLEGVVHKDVGELSKGYRQRVGLAQTLIHDPDFLILDEPTTGLDPNQIKEIRALIRKIGEKKTIILSTHILSEVQATCSRAIIIDRGKLVADGHPDELVGKLGKGAVRYQVVVRGAGAPAEVLAAYRGVAGVKDIEALPESGRGLRFAVAGAGEDVGEDLFKVTAAKGWTLTELSPERASLEDVFSQLTTGGGK
jgi:ABC-2 type transport system ATP-binding protein